MANKLLLIEDVESLGRSGDIVSVRPGYARNFLLPQGLAMIADKNTIRMQGKLQKERDERAAVDLKESQDIAAKLEGQSVTKEVKVDHDGHMYGSVSTQEISHLIHSQLSMQIEKHSIVLKHALKTTGEHKVNIKLKEGVTASINVVIAPENANQPKEATSK